MYGGYDTYFERWNYYMVTINGDTFELPKGSNLSLKDYLESKGYTLQRVAVECNGDIVPKCEYSNKTIHDGDVLEVISFVGGG